MARTFNEVMDRFRSITFEDEFDIIVAIANGGIVPAGILINVCKKRFIY